MEEKTEITPIINKIEVDEKTAEPIIVEVSEKELKKQERLNKRVLDEKYNFVETKSVKSIGEQLVMTKVFSFQKDESVSKRQHLFKTIFTVFFIVFVVAVLALTAYNDFFAENSDRQPFSWQTLSAIFSESWFYIIFALVSLYLCFFFKGAKLSVMCKSLTGEAKFSTCFETGIIGSYYNCVTPLAVGGQPFEIYHLSKHGVHGGVAASLPIAAFFLNQFAFVVLGILSLSFFHLNFFSNIFPGVFAVLAIVGLVCCLLMPTMVIIFSLMPRASAKLVYFVMWLGGKLHIVKRPRETTFKTLKTVVHNSRCLKKLGTRPLAFALSLIISFCEQFAIASIAYFTLRFFGFDMPDNGFLEWLQIVQITFILNASVSFVPTPGNSGAADLSFYVLFQAGLIVGLAFPAMVVWRILSFYSFIIVGFVFASLKKKADRRKALNNEQLQ